MISSSSSPSGKQRVPGGGGTGQVSLEHYFRLILHRKWLVAGVFVAVTIGTCIFTRTLPDVYVSETTVLVDPQKVPEAYVKATVTGDVRNRLGTLSQQILSATRLQKIIDSLNLYPEERKKLAREEIIVRMRSDINVSVVSDFNSGQDVQAFRIGYSGREPRLVAQVTNELASLFMEENLKVREAQAEGTTEFLTNQMQETRKTLEAQEGKLRDFQLKHIGEMPEQQTSDLQILGQKQAQLQMIGDSLSRAESQKSMIQSMMSQQSAPVVDVDETEQRTVSTQAPVPAAAQQSAPAQSALSRHKAQLEEGLKHWGEANPEIRKLRLQIADDESKESAGPKPPVPAPAVELQPPTPPLAQANRTTPAKRTPPPPVAYTNPVLQSQLKNIDDDIAKNKADQQALNKQIGDYQRKLEAIPVRQQEIADLTRDYEISKAHYSQLLNNQMNAETASQLEIRQKGEKFSVLDTATPAEKPSRPKRFIMNVGGGAAGLVLGIVFALISEFLGMSITAADQVFAVTGFQVLEVIPMIRTEADRLARRRQVILAAVCGLAATLALSGGLLYYYRSQIF